MWEKVIGCPSIRDEDVGRRLAQGQTPSRTGISEHDSQKRLPTVSSGLAINNSGQEFNTQIPPGTAAKSVQIY